MCIIVESSTTTTTLADTKYTTSSERESLQ